MLCATEGARVGVDPSKFVALGARLKTGGGAASGMGVYGWGWEIPKPW